MKIDVSDRDFFQRHGVVCLRSVLDENWLHKLAQGFDKVMAAPSTYACYYTGADAPGLFRDDYCNWQRIAQFRETIFDSPLGEMAAQLLGSSTIRFFHDHVFFKKKGTVKKTPWHQDLPYYCVDGDHGISFWIPLTVIDASNKIEFIAGSHRTGKLYRPTKFNGVDVYDVPAHLYDEIPNFDDGNWQKLSWVMEPGDIIAFDFRTVHGNTVTSALSANESDRKSVSLRFLGENMRFSTRLGEKSPPFPELALEPGAELAHPSFPIVFGGGLERERFSRQALF